MDAPNTQIHDRSFSWINTGREKLALSLTP